MRRIAFQKIGLIFGLIILLSSIVLVSESCHKNITPETPKAALALKADDIVIRVNELQATVIQYCGAGPECVAGTIPTPIAREIVQGTVDLLKILKTVPDGWQTTVKSTWAKIKPRFSGITNPAITAAFAVVDGILGGLQ